MPLLLVTIICIEIFVWSELEILSPSLPYISDEFGLSMTELGFVVSVSFLMHSFLLLFIGKISDTHHKYKVLSISLFIFSIGSFVGYISNGYNYLLFSRIIQGIGITAPSLLCNVLITTHYPLSKQKQIVNLTSGIATILVIFSPMVGNYINTLYGWRTNFLLLFSIAAICSILSFYIFLKKKLY